MFLLTTNEKQNRAILTIIVVHSRYQSEQMNYIDGSKTVSQPDTSGHYCKCMRQDESKRLV